MKSLHIKIIMMAVFVLVIFCSLLIWKKPKEAKADSISLYANECDGGFENAGNATGSPDVSDNQVSSFSLKNSAVLNSGTQAELHCRSFKNEETAGIVPKKITARFSWIATYADVVNNGEIETPSIDSGPVLIEEGETQISTTSTATDTPLIKEEAKEVVPNDSASESTEEVKDVEEKVQDINLQIEEVKVEESAAPAPATPEPISFLNYIAKIAFAEEVATTTVQEDTLTEIVVPTFTVDVIASTTENILLPIVEDNIATTSSSTITESSSTEPITEKIEEPYGVLEVLWTEDGTTLNRLGFVEIDKFDKTSFDIPLPKEGTWDSIEKIQIFIRSVQSIDNKSPIIYVDSVWLDVEYNSLESELHPYPSEDRGDVFIGGVNYENYTGYLVARPGLKLLASSTLIKINDTGTTTSSTTFQAAEIWILDNSSDSQNKWIFVSDSKKINTESKVYFRYGYLFWLEGTSTLWVFNPKSQAYDSISLETDISTQYIFKDEAGEQKVMIISPYDNLVSFEDYIPPVAQ